MSSASGHNVLSVTINNSGHTDAITSCQLVGNFHIMTSSLDGTVKLWKRTGDKRTTLLKSLKSPVSPRSSPSPRSKSPPPPIHKAVCVPDKTLVGKDSDKFLILAGTEPGYLVVWRQTLIQIEAETKQKDSDKDNKHMVDAYPHTAPIVTSGDQQTTSQETPPRTSTTEGWVTVDCKDAKKIMISAGTKPGSLVVQRQTVTGEEKSEKDGVDEDIKWKKHVSLHAPNPLTALVVTNDGRYLITGCCYNAFGLSGNMPSRRLDRRTRGTVKMWNLKSLLSLKSYVDLTLVCSRTAHQLASSVTSAGKGEYGVTCLALSEDSSLLAVGLSTTPPGTAPSSSSSSSPAVVVVCSREKLEPLWTTDDLTSTWVYGAIFHCQQHSWSLFIATNTTVEMLQITEKTSQQMTGLITLCLQL